MTYGSWKRGSRLPLAGDLRIVKIERERMMLGLSLVLLLTGASPPPAPGPPVTPCPILEPGSPEPEAITKPTFLRLPSSNEIMAAFPVEALKRHQEGRAVLKCIAQFDGSLKNCIIVSETPAGLGFADGALRASTTIRLAAKEKDGAAVACRPMTMPIGFAAD
jgi:protein TonB